MRIGRLSWIAALLIIGCSPDTVAQDSPEQAVNRHIAAATAGDIAALRSGACGVLAAAMGKHSDPEVREEFSGAYDTGPDKLTADGAGPQRQMVTGYYAHVTDLEIAFVAENHDGWKVCEIRRGNGRLGRLPGPFE